MKLAIVGGGLAAAGVMAQPTPMPTRTPGAPPNCIYDSARGATYDLGQMYNPYGYTIFDTGNKTLPSLPQYAIKFSLCTNIDPVAAGIPQCATTYGLNNQSMTGPGPAFLYCTANCNQPGTTQCNRLGLDAFQAQLRVFPWNPAHGVSVTYMGGDQCNTASGPNGMGLELDIQCADRGGVIGRQVDIIPSGDGCFYNALFTSDAACPLECPLVTQPPGIIRRVCGGRGICDYDRSKVQARCFCNQGWSGPDCMSPGDKGLPAAPTFAGNLAGGFIGGLIGGAALFVAALFARAKMTNSVSIVDTINFGGLVGGYTPAAGGTAQAAAIAASGFGSDAGAGGATAASMDDAYGKLAVLGGADGMGGASSFGGSTGYVAPDLGAAPAGSESLLA